ncbi:hypothetical protein B0H10DRAFT_1914609 [Mycena sp. CBHHK59/15]|nr:hypothetical protein B0H10DRAFT_1914609 [Mycena sp. CBHHK59/15]
MARRAFLSFLCFLWLVLPSASSQSPVFNIPSTVQNGTSHAQFTSSSTGLDAPKVQPINGSAFDWWYFDVVSADPTNLASVVVTFFTSSQPAFPLLAPSSFITVARIWVSFPNGTLFSAASDADGATVISDGDNSSGTWNGTGFSWMNIPSGNFIVIDAPDLGVKGTISLQSIVPAHYPCAAAKAGQTMEVAPHVGWSNAIPDAVSEVNLSIGGTKLAFTGSGYHDKNWSDQVFTTHVASWYWGHGRLGPYSIVWFDFLDRTGTEFVSAYAARNGKIVAASCALGSITVRPTGPNATYPPVISSPNPTGYHIDLDLGSEGMLTVNVNVLAPLIAPNPEYARSVGNLSGSVVPASPAAAQVLTGMALFEQFKLTV